MISSVTLAGEEWAATLQRREFRAMGTAIELLLHAEPSLQAARLLRRAEGEFRRLENLLSRFIPDSELSRLNRAGRLLAGADLVRVVELSLAARERTGGRFDPTVHSALVAAGYDRSFEQLPRERTALRDLGAPCGGKVEIDLATHAVELEAGVELDLGGIAKGYAVDRAARILSAGGACLVNAGGDIAVQGTSAGPWPVEVETPTGSVVLALKYGGLATSGRDRRRWRVAGEERHHLIDPRTGRPSSSDLMRVTVVGATAVDAEVLAKALFLAGENDAVAEADALGTPCLLITDDDRVVLAGGLSP